LKSLAKQVNLKTKIQSLDEKQRIFNKVVEGLKDKSGISKKNKKKNRVMLRKVYYLAILGIKETSVIIADKK
jgi:hypothetical protein